MSGKAACDFRVLERYARLEPQSRTYPEVSILDDHFGEQQYRHHVDRSNAALIPKPIAIDLNVPEGSGSPEHSIEQLLREMELIAPSFDQDRDVVRLRWGGPADRLDAELSDRVLEGISRRFHVAGTAVPGYRIGMDAADVDTGRIAALRADGTHRIEIQVVFGLTPQPMEGFEAAIRAVTVARPDRIDLIDGVLTLPGEPSMSGLDAMTRLLMLEHAVNLLMDAGYTHRCKGRFDLDGTGNREIECDRVGIGPGAISRLGDCVSENHLAVPRWQSAIDARRWPVARGKSLTAEDRQHAARLRRLLGTSEGVISAIGQDPGVTSEGLDALRQLDDLGLTRTEDRRIASTSRGRYLWRILAGCFDPDRMPNGRTARHAERHAEERRRGETAQ